MNEKEVQNGLSNISTDPNRNNESGATLAGTLLLIVTGKPLS